eukprot:2311070-Prymnesium_polylepis.1
MATQSHCAPPANPRPARNVGSSPHGNLEGHSTRGEWVPPPRDPDRPHPVARAALHSHCRPAAPCTPSAGED